jgi:uncharacterized membrane protein YkvA (DUF1232 family)
MAIHGSSRLLRPPALCSLLLQARLAIRLMREPRVPVLLKTIPVLAALYVISPIDLVPDLVPVLGQLDDLGIIVAALELFTRLSPSGAQAFHREAIGRRRAYSPMSPTDDVIEPEWRRVDPISGRKRRGDAKSRSLVR